MVSRHLFTDDLLCSCLGHGLVDESLRVSVKWDLGEWFQSEAKSPFVCRSSRRCLVFCAKRVVLVGDGSMGCVGVVW